jgi:putative resolvase
MKAKEVMGVLRISKSTLYRLRKEKCIDCKKLPNGQYEYSGSSVYAYLAEHLGESPERKTVIYGRVSTPKQKQDLENQLNNLKQFCINKGWVISGVYSDVASVLNFEKRKGFSQLLEDVLDYKIERIVITFKDRLTRTGFTFFENLFRTYGTEIVVLNDYLNEKTDEEELMEEIFTLLYSFSMKFYSKRRQIKKSVEDAIK